MSGPGRGRRWRRRMGRRLLLLRMGMGMGMRMGTEMGLRRKSRKWEILHHRACFGEGKPDEQLAATATDLALHHTRLFRTNHYAARGRDISKSQRPDGEAASGETVGTASGFSQGEARDEYGRTWTRPNAPVRDRNVTTTAGRFPNGTEPACETEEAEPLRREGCCAMPCRHSMEGRSAHPTCTKRDFHHSMTRSDH